MPYEGLLRPLQLGDFTLKNRIWMSAVSRNRAKNSYPTELMKEYYVQRAVGGAGLIICAVLEYMWDDKHVAGWKNITDRVHAVGGKIYAQLSHVGRLSHPDDLNQKLSGLPVYGPSAIPARGIKFRNVSGGVDDFVPRAVEDPRILIEQFRHATINAKKAGFDGVEPSADLRKVHACNGMLVNQFLDLSCNQRTDEWGGSVENRSRFGLEILKIMIDIFGRNVSVKVNPAGGPSDTGMPLKDTLETFSYFLSKADKLGVSYIAISRYDSRYDTVIHGVPRGAQHNELESYRPYIKNAKLFLNGHVTPDEAELLISQGKIDGVFFGNGWISHPDLAKRLEHGLPLDVPPSVAHLYGGADEDIWNVGYTTIPLRRTRIWRRRIS
ncbi:hypothetical protein CPB84DRAFT_1961227 [Gymnopilus junonius]|uniref:NADH:flavin oxidoreductase/NADH oxidase N-terminal domain-containing protein n=1 Tax=Gymnopilus junonius TaxID=109634 RepID=A0A9P5NRZ6_GYMJU|nr:hypothetical protein CPB84DRAFT_1961227 [Gymnopilus junonius]